MNRYKVDVHMRNGNKIFVTTESFSGSATTYLAKLLTYENGSFIILDDVSTNEVHAITKEEIEGITCLKVGEDDNDEE
jgi:hypothetical protein